MLPHNYYIYTLHIRRLTDLCENYSSHLILATFNRSCTDGRTLSFSPA